MRSCQRQNASLPTIAKRLPGPSRPNALKPECSYACLAARATFNVVQLTTYVIRRIGWRSREGTGEASGKISLYSPSLFASNHAFVRIYCIFRMLLTRDTAAPVAVQFASDALNLLSVTCCTVCFWSYQRERRN